MSIRTPSILAGCVVAAAASLSWAQSFTYQGQLTATGTGVASEGYFDFVFRVYDAASAGAQVGATANVAHVLVQHGVFTATVDPGAGVFTGGGPDRWLEVGVRPEGTILFTTLSPRQKVRPTPYAIRALNEWFAPLAVDSLTNDASRPRLLLNRSGPLTSAEYLGLTTPTGAGAFGGMYINTANATGLPFYGYGAGGAPMAYTYFVPSDSSWRLSVNGDRLVVAGGKLGVGVEPTETVDAGAGNARAASFKFSTPKVRHMSIPPCAFMPRTPNAVVVVEDSNGGAYYDAAVGAGNLIAPIQIPDGARITNITTWMIDNSTTVDMMALLFTRGYASSGYSLVGSGTTTGASAAAQAISVNYSQVVDNATTTYILSVYCNDWAGTATQLKGGMVTYEVSEAD